MVDNIVGMLPAFSPFPTMFSKGFINWVVKIVKVQRVKKTTISEAHNF